MASPSRFDAVAHQGVSLLIDLDDDGKQYVGSAKGTDSLLGRFSGYAKGGTTGNRGLTRGHRYVVSVLEPVAMLTPDQTIEAVESQWKDRLGTREYGLNQDQGLGLSGWFWSGSYWSLSFMTHMCRPPRTSAHPAGRARAQSEATEPASRTPRRERCPFAPLPAWVAGDRGRVLPSCGRSVSARESEIKMEIVGLIVAGLIIGLLGKLAAPGDKDNIPLWATLLCGVGGVLLGGAIYRAFGGNGSAGIDWTRWIVAIATAAVLTVVASSLLGRSTTHRGTAARR